MSGAGGLGAPEVSRKLLHIGAGLLALTLPWLDRWDAAFICLGAFLLNWLVLPRITRHRLERAEDRARGLAAGIVVYPLSVGLLLVLFGSRMEVVAAAWGILAFGDGFATIAGRIVGGPALAWNPAKTLSGFVAFILSGGPAATLLYLWVAGPAGPGPVAAAGLCFGAALLAALVESFPSGIDDNITVPLMAGGFLYGLSLVQAQRLLDGSDILLANLTIGLGVNLVVSLAAWRARAVSASGAIAGCIIGVAIYTFGGWRSYILLVLFFLLASFATRLGHERKKALGIAQEAGGRRGPRHAVANCGVPAFLVFLAAATAHEELFQVALVASLATAAFDTVSSEIGQAYGYHPMLITTFRRVPPGTEGAVSLEGTLAGLSAATLLALAGAWLGMTSPWRWTGAAIVIAASVVGSTVESLLGAAGRHFGREGTTWIDNDAMNLANTLAGAVAALGLAALMLS